MSKSLKNFLSIRETLQVTPAPTLRLMFLMHQWDAVLDYSTDSIGEAKGMQNSIEVSG
jgi:cysteinyl-tRNA synthetase